MRQEVIQGILVRPAPTVACPVEFSVRRVLGNPVEPLAMQAMVGGKPKQTLQRPKACGARGHSFGLGLHPLQARPTHDTSLGMHDVVFQVAFTQGLEGACAHVQRQPAQGQPHRIQVGKQRVVEVQSRSRCGHAPRGHGEHGLIVVLVAFHGRPAHVRRKRCVAKILEHLCKRRVGVPIQAHRPSPILPSLFTLDGHVGRDASHGSVAVRPTFGVPYHRLPSAGLRALKDRLHGRRRRGQQEHFQPSSRGFGGQNPGVQHLGVVGPQAIHPLALKQVGQRLKRVVRHRTLAGANKHSGRPPRVHWFLGDGLLRQRILKLL